MTAKEDAYTLDLVAEEALTYVQAVREEDPHDTHAHITRRCAAKPEHMARVVMALAVFTPPDEGMHTLRARIAAASAPRVGRAA